VFGGSMLRLVFESETVELLLMKYCSVRKGGTN
jgi:hypothetical protein